jgi:hypothetical protein
MMATDLVERAAPGAFDRKLDCGLLGLDGVWFLRADTHLRWGIASMARAAAPWARFS